MPHISSENIFENFSSACYNNHKSSKQRGCTKFSTVICYFDFLFFFYLLRSSNLTCLTQFIQVTNCMFKYLFLFWMSTETCYHLSPVHLLILLFKSENDAIQEMLYLQSRFLFFNAENV